MKELWAEPGTKGRRGGGAVAGAVLRGRRVDRLCPPRPLPCTQAAAPARASAEVGGTPWQGPGDHAPDREAEQTRSELRASDSSEQGGGGLWPAPSASSALQVTFPLAEPASCSHLERREGETGTTQLCLPKPLKDSMNTKQEQAWMIKSSTQGIRKCPQVLNDRKIEMHPPPPNLRI